MQDYSRQVVIAIRWLPIILICAIAAGGLAYAYFDGQPRVYQATAQLAVDPGPDPSIQDAELETQQAAAYARRASSLLIARRVIDELELEESARTFVERVSTDVDPDSNILSISATGSDPEEAQSIARALGGMLIAAVRADLITPEVRDVDSAIARNEALIKQLNSRRLGLRQKANKSFEERVELATLPREIADLEAAILQMRPSSTTGVRHLLEWWEQPALPAVPIEPRPLYWALLALVVGGMLGVGIAFVVEYLRRVNKVRDERDLEFATGLPSLGLVAEAKGDRGRPDGERLVMMRYPRSDGAEAYRDVIARMGFSGGTTRTLAVTSAKPTDARGLVAANVALAYAEAGRNVILVDADFRSPRMHSFFGVPNDRGLTTILTDANVPLGWATVPTPHPRLGLMPSGPLPRETAEPLGTRQLNALLRRLLQAADLVIVHSPAMHGHIDAAVLAEQLDAVLLVVPHDSRADETEEAARSLQGAEAEFVGAVLYRPVRRTRKGARVEVAAAPGGWGPTWPGLYDAPAQIPALARAGRQSRPSSGGAAAPSYATKQSGQAPIILGSGRSEPSAPAPGPFTVPFRSDASGREGGSIPPDVVSGAAPTQPPLSQGAPNPAAQGHSRPLQAVGPGPAGDPPVDRRPVGRSPAAAGPPFAGTFQAVPFTPPPAARPATPASAASTPMPASPDGRSTAASAAKRNGRGQAGQPAPEEDVARATAGNGAAPAAAAPKGTPGPATSHS